MDPPAAASASTSRSAAAGPTSASTSTGAHPAAAPSTSNGPGTSPSPAAGGLLVPRPPPAAPTVTGAGAVTGALLGMVTAPGSAVHALPTSSGSYAPAPVPAPSAPIVGPAAVTLPPGVDHEITLLISDYLSSRHPQLAELLAQEIGPVRDEAVRAEIDAVERAILDGDFGSIEKLLGQGLLGPQTRKAFLYMCYRQQFLEYIDNRESQKAFNLLQKRLKPLEHYQPVPYDFYSLAYLTSASTVHDAPGLRDWAGAGPERERLVQMWRELTEGRRPIGTAELVAPTDRLVTLLKQAAAWQVANTRPRGTGPWAVPSLLADYAPSTVPSKLERLIRGHRANVKCVDWLSDALGVSGSSDTTLRIFSVEDGSTQRVLTGHQSRLWDVAASPSGSLIASGSGDGTVRIWNAAQGSNGYGDCLNVLAGDGGDIYGVRWQPWRDDVVVAACYDKILRLWDVEAGKLVRTFSGHAQSTLAVTFDPTGKVIASGSKDKHIRLWDAVGGVCVQTMTAHLGEVTSVEFDHEGKYLLAGCKDNSHRLWDLRMQRNIYRYTGHQNTSKNIIRCSFASPSSGLVAGGSEDGLVYLWEREATPDDSSMRVSLRDSGVSTPVSPQLVAGGGDAVAAAAASAWGSPTATLFSAPSNATTLPRSGAALPSTAAFAPASTSSRVSAPAYYPPRSFARTSSTTSSVATSALGGTPTTTVRPLKAMAGHGAGAVFDVRARRGCLLSAGEDGAVGVWGDE